MQELNLPQALLGYELFGVAIYVVALSCLYLGGVVYCTWDAVDHTDYALAWFFVFLILGPISMPLYIGMSLYARRETSQARLDRAAFERKGHEFKFTSEIERFKFLERIADGGGQLYELPNQLPSSPSVRKVFSDSQAELLIGERHYDTAREYLGDLLALAEADKDADRLATYRWYLAQLPALPLPEDAAVAAPREVEPAGLPPDVRRRLGIN